MRLLPIGGYCQFYGEDEEKNDPRAFNNQPVWKRAITVFSGPLMNFVIAFLVIALFMSAIGVNASCRRWRRWRKPRRRPVCRSATKSRR